MIFSQKRLKYKQLKKHMFRVENVCYGDTNGIPQKCLKKVVLGDAGGHAQFWFCAKNTKRIQIYV